MAIRKWLENIINRFWSNDTPLKIAIILVMLSLLGVTFMIALFPIHYRCFITPNFWAVYVSSGIAIANALLLYATLRSQNESIVNTKEAHRQERFETTFFNLLDYQRRLTEEIVINYDYVDNNVNITSQEVKGREAFSFANSELGMISESLKSNISALYDFEQVMYEKSDFDREWDERDPTHVLEEQRFVEWNELKGKIQIKNCNRVYGITKEYRQKFHTDSTIPYKLFMQKWKPSFERYIRNLECLLQHMCEEHQLHGKWRQKYIKFLQSQMTRDELQLIEKHAQSIPGFRKMLDKTHLTDIITNDKI